MGQLRLIGQRSYSLVIIAVKKQILTIVLSCTSETGLDAVYVLEQSRCSEVWALCSHMVVGLLYTNFICHIEDYHSLLVKFEW